MSETRARYIAKLQVLRRWLSDYFSVLRVPQFTHVRNMWDGFPVQRLILEAESLATDLQLPPAIQIGHVPGDKIKGLKPDVALEVAPGNAWRAAGIEVFDLEMKRYWWPLWYEERVPPDDWVMRGELHREFPDHHTPEYHKVDNYALKMYWSIDKWVKFVAIIPAPSGIIDTPVQG